MHKMFQVSPFRDMNINHDKQNGTQRAEFHVCSIGIYVLPRIKMKSIAQTLRETAFI